MEEREVTRPVNFFRVVIKGLLLFVAINLIFSVFSPLSRIGKVSLYNWLLPGRARLPYGDQPELAYNLNLFNLEAMLASHEISGTPKSSNEYRVILIGDSATWGFLLTPEQTLSAHLNNARLKSADGKQVKVYNLGYPTMSLTKDLLFLQQAIQYQPDLIVWLTTLESFPDSKQLQSPIVQNNPGIVETLIDSSSLDLHSDDPLLVKQSFIERSLIGQRRVLADILRLQLYGFLWAATGIDQYYPPNYEPPQADFDPDPGFHEFSPPTLNPDLLALEALNAGISMANGVPILFVNEPIYISKGEHSDIRYNFFYPRWAYDQYRSLMQSISESKGWYYLDAWDLVPPDEFTNSAIHFSPSGEALLAEKVGEAIIGISHR